MLSFSYFFPSDFVISDIIPKEQTITIKIVSSQSKSQCPRCGDKASRIHSHCGRRVGDLPIFGHKVYLEVNARKFFCDSLGCEQKIFTERFKNLVSPYSRKTNRLNDFLIKTAFSLSAECASSLVKHSIASASPDSLLRLIRRSEVFVPSDVKYIGIDDWALRKNRS